MDDLILDRSTYRIHNTLQPVSRTPYPFQEEAFSALDAVRAADPKGFSTMLVLPTGAGKTYTAAHWVLKRYVNENTKVLWIAHRSELLRQAAEALYADASAQTLPDRSSFETYVSSSEFGYSCNVRDEDVVIASRQSIMSGDNLAYYINWAKKHPILKPSRLLIVIDEAHHAAASSYRTIIRALKKKVHHVDILGLTATPYRTAKSEQGSLKKIFTTGSGIAYSVDMNTLIKAGILSTPVHIEVPTSVDMTKVFDAEELRKVARTDFSSLDEKSLDKLNRNTDRNKIIVDTYIQNRKKFGKTIVFAVDVANAIALNAIFRACGVRSDFVVSSLVSGMNRSASTERNPWVLRAFKDGELDVLINVNIVTEGTDIPNIQTVFLARPTTSKILMTQMIGRGLRGEAAGGTKETFLVYFTDDWKGLIDFVSPSALLDGDDVVPLQRLERKKQLRKYIELSELEAYALSLYQTDSPVRLQCSNIIPFGIITCSYFNEDALGNERAIQKNILVYDEAADAYRGILAEVPGLVSERTDEAALRKISNRLFFKYAEQRSGVYIGLSSDHIYDILRSCQNSGECPVIAKIEDRVSLSDVVNELYRQGMTEQEFDKQLEAVWKNRPKIRSWFEHDFFVGMAKVFYNRLRRVELHPAQTVLAPKEEMTMFELKKHYPAYYKELRDYVIQNAERDDEGYYYSAIQEEGKPRFRSKHLMMFEIDHIYPISKGGRTVKENLRLISRYENRQKGNKVQ